MAAITGAENSVNRLANLQLRTNENVCCVLPPNIMDHRGRSKLFCYIRVKDGHRQEANGRPAAIFPHYYLLHRQLRSSSVSRILHGLALLLHFSKGFEARVSAITQGLSRQFQLITRQMIQPNIGNQYGVGKESNYFFSTSRWRTTWLGWALFLAGTSGIFIGGWLFVFRDWYARGGLIMLIAGSIEWVGIGILHAIYIR